MPKNEQSFIFMLTSERSFTFISALIMNTKSILTTIAFCATATIASAAGYQVLEQGASNMGTAIAGATVNANADATTAFWNPSAATAIDLEVGETRFDAALFAIIPTLGCSIDSANPPAGAGTVYDGDCSADSYVPQFFVAHRFTEDLYGTLSITAPWGLESDYDPNWVGNTMAIRSYLFTVDVNPSLAYNVNDWLSISGGVSVQYAYCKLTNMYVHPAYNAVVGKFSVSGDGYAVGGNIGFTVKYAEGGRFGFQWRSAVEHTLKGNAKLNGNILAPVSADMHMPHTFTMGVYQRLWGSMREFAVMADYAYTMWSMFDQLEIKGLPTSQVVQENWRDTSRVSLGMHFYPEAIEDLTLRLGIAYDQSPVDKIRTARIPCGDRIWFSGGLGYIWENISFDLTYSYIWVIGNNPLMEESQTITGDYKAHIHVIGAQVGYKF